MQPCCLELHSAQSLSPGKLHCTILELNNLPSCLELCSNSSQSNLNFTLHKINPQASPLPIGTPQCAKNPTFLASQNYTKFPPKCPPSAGAHWPHELHRSIFEVPLLPSLALLLKNAQTCLPRSHLASTSDYLNCAILLSSGPCEIFSLSEEYA